MTRVYLPATLSTLAQAYVSSGFESGHDAHAVTPAIREWYVEGDLEELEYVAFTEAALASLRLLAADVSAEARYENRRVVVAADVPDEAVLPLAGTEPGVAGPATSPRSRVRLSCTVRFADVASVHIDDEAVSRVIGAAVRALPAADAGDDDARFTLDEAAAQDLLWFDVSELPDLI